MGRAQRRENSVSVASQFMNSSEISLPVISEFRTITSLKEKQNIYLNKIESKGDESLLKSLRHLQKSQDYGSKSKRETSPEIKNNQTCVYVPKLVNKKRRSISKDTNSLICKFTLKKYIKDVYIKNKVPNFDNKAKKRSKRASKIRKINKSQIKVKKENVVAQLDISKLE